MKDDRSVQTVQDKAPRGQISGAEGSDGDGLAVPGFLANRRRPPPPPSYNTTIHFESWLQPSLHTTIHQHHPYTIAFYSNLPPAAPWLRRFHMCYHDRTLDTLDPTVEDARTTSMATHTS
ncbi:hypothetical protein E2P81_ATG01328 [Venturia nashicola]|nr:hypothetical protein E2P81_ATG01328 [Venturia nashicola]